MVNLSIYRFTLVNKVKEQQVLNFYNEEEDLLETMNDFCSHIHRNIKSYIDVQGKYRTFSLSNNQLKDVEKRIITGYFDSGYTGEYGQIKDGQTSNLKYDILKGDVFSKDFFYLINVPKNSKFGFLIFQKKENHGVKVIFENAFNSFIRLKGVSNYFLQLRQAPARYLINNFLKFGKLKEFRLIDSFQSDKVGNINLGKEEWIFKPKGISDEGKELKNVLVALFNSVESTEERISFLDKGEFNEIAFVLEYGKASKTFYIKNKDKIRSNVDVSTLLEYDNGEPTIESLRKISLEIIGLAS